MLRSLVVLVAGVTLLACNAGSRPETAASPAAAAPSPLSWKQPDAYRGIPWKASVTEAQGKITPPPAYCFCSATDDISDSDNCPFAAAADPSKAPVLRTCSAALDVAGVSIEELLLFERDQLHGSMWTFDASDYDKMAGIFKERYGNPTTTTNAEVSNRMGAKFMNTTMGWAGPRVTVELVRYGSDLTKSSAMIALNEYNQRREAATAAKTKKGAEAF